MAITKIHPIKTTLNLSIDYICDPAKTDEEILISSYKCGYKTAALQFENTKELMNSPSKNLARHLIQSFMPGEVSAEKAHQIGEELCAKHLQGKYEYVLTTHVDKGHIHNHIIFSNVSFIDGKAYVSNKRSYHQIRNMSDEICKSNGLSIATDTPSSQNKFRTSGTSYKEYQERKHGNSYKAKLQYAIDAAIRSAADWEDFLRLLQNSGYEIKFGKHISFRAIGQERFTRSKVIGEDYTEENIKNRILNKVEISKPKYLNKARSSNKVIDISAQKAAIQSEGFKRWLKLQNLKNVSKSWNDISAIGAADIGQFYSYISQLHDELSATQTEIKNIESDINNIATLIKNTATVEKYKSIYTGFQNSTDKDAYFRMYEREIILYEAAQHSVEISTSPLITLPTLELKNRIANQSNKLTLLSKTLDDQKKKIAATTQLRSNLETYLHSSNSIDIEK